ncbi:MAG: NMD3-related protein [Candidatus Poseidoniia archaeon]|nr:NMD3-related protein [Candidatus Poseidoniia archaeon]
MDICLKCGAKPPLISQICHKCVRETVAISRLPEVLRMVDCKSCYSLKIPGTWLEFDDLESAVSHFFESSIIWEEDLSQQKTNLELEQLDPAKFRVKANTKANYGGLSLESNLEGVVEIKYQVCQTCSRHAGGYYEAILQIRTKQRSVLDAAVEKVFKDIDSSPSEFFSTENGSAKGGFDFQLSSTERARSLARELMIQFGGHVNETNTLVGRKDGRDLLRHTFGVRLPSFLVGDYLLIQEKVYRVTRLDRRKAKLRLME